MNEEKNYEDSQSSHVLPGVFYFQNIANSSTKLFFLMMNWSQDELV